MRDDSLMSTIQITGCMVVMVIKKKIKVKEKLK
jgi:hypothetical protein